MRRIELTKSLRISHLMNGIPKMWLLFNRSEAEILKRALDHAGIAGLPRNLGSISLGAYSVVVTAAPGTVWLRVQQPQGDELNMRMDGPELDGLREALAAQRALAK